MPDYQCLSIANPGLPRRKYMYHKLMQVENGDYTESAPVQHNDNERR